MSPPTLRPALDFHPATNLVDRVVVEQPFRTFANVTLDRFEGGAFSYVSPGTELHRVRLGRYCSVGDGVMVLSRHPTDTLTTSPFPYQSIFPPPFHTGQPVNYDHLADTIIGNDVWIGSGVRIKTGVKIGDGAIIGAGSVVTRDVPPFAIYGGVPAKLIRARFDSDTAARIASLQWWQYNLVGEQLPWTDLNALLEALAGRIANGGIAPYRSNRFSIFREGALIKCSTLQPGDQ